MSDTTKGPHFWIFNSKIALMSSVVVSMWSSMFYLQASRPAAVSDRWDSISRDSHRFQASIAPPLLPQLLIWAPLAEQAPIQVWPLPSRGHMSLLCRQCPEAPLLWKLLLVPFLFLYEASWIQGKRRSHFSSGESDTVSSVTWDSHRLIDQE